ncbi:hypothetical protein [Amnibacterium kyonggiense]
MSAPSRPRELAFRFVGPIIGVVIGVGVVGAVTALSGSRLLPPGLLIGVLAGAAVVALGATAVGLLIGRRIVGDRLEVALRVPDARWRHGRLEADADRSTFHPYVWQVRIPTGEREELGPTAIRPDAPRRPALRTIWSLNPQTRIVTLETARGPVEVAALPSRLELLRQRLAAGRASGPGA